jgi:hypothetical protein
MLATAFVTFFASRFYFMLSLKPLGFVLTTGLHPLVSKTAAHGTEPADVPYARTVVEVLRLA